MFAFANKDGGMGVLGTNEKKKEEKNQHWILVGKVCS